MGRMGSRAQRGRHGARWERAKVAVVVVAMAASAGACSRAATLQLRDSSVARERIAGGTADDLVLESGRVVPRGEIDQIRHPGSAAIGLGLGIAAYGILNIAAAASTCGDRYHFRDPTRRAAFCFGMVVPLGVGAGMLMWGGAVRQESLGRALDETYELPAAAGSPAAAPAPDVPTTPAAPPLTPVLPVGTLTVVSVPNGLVFIDGVPAGGTPYSAAVTATRHHVRVQNALGTRAWWVVVPEGQTVRVDAQMLEETAEGAGGAGGQPATPDALDP